MPLMINWNRVAELRHEVGEDDFDEVVELFIEEVEDVLATLGQNDDLPKDLHFLKGSALNLGFTEMARLCTEGERGAPDITAIRSSYTDAKTELMQGV